ncbi:unnamed protein product [Polarella glacialis]|uniref:Enoyl-CoA hydratase n=1 Tax=Polarella glacialis TaxID=89957 RepID=A0A813J972_POLGL|nr:unnamed protein product [Polarella glacialis]
MISMMDASPKTTVAAVNGQALGGGAEVSLGCHYRVASAKAAFAFPEVSLGLLPGGQGTQRLPRVAPLMTAVQMILQGKVLPAAAAMKNGIIDAVAKGDVVDEAAAFALSKPPNPISKRPVAHADRFYAASGALDQALLMAHNQAPTMVAPASIIACLKAACSTMSFAEGLKVEASEFTKLVFSIQSAAMRHLFFAERAAQKVPGVNAKPMPIKKIGILGAGLMGGGIAMCFAQKGVPVILKDAKQEWLDAGMKKITGLWASKAKKGKMTEDKYKQLVALVTPTLNYEDFKDVDMVIEAVPEIMDLKKQVFLDMEKHMRPDAMICTNTSGLDINEIAAVLKDPSRVMGCHFFSPANVMQLLENIQTKHSSELTLSTGMAMGKLISKKTVMVGNCDGFVGNRMLAPYAGEAKMLWEEGATIEQIDAVWKFGMAMGPMALGDLVGQVVDFICEKGRFGMKTPDASTKGVVPRAVSEEEIIERLFYSMINEGMKILEEGFVAKSSDVDIVYLYGYGFPPAKGGPMFFAENYVGFPKILERLKVYNAAAKERFTKNKHYLPVDYFEPSKLLEMVAEAQKKGVKAPPGRTLIDVVLKEHRGKSSSPGPFSKL